MRKFLPIILLAVVVLAAGIYTGYVNNVRKAKPLGPVLTFTVLSADYGNAIVITTPEGKHAVIDPGPIATQEPLIEYLRTTGINKPIIVLTSPSAARCGALQELLETTPVKRVLRGVQEDNSSAYKNAMETAAELKISQLTLSAGDAISLSRSTKLEVLNPPARLIQGTGNDHDNNSLVIRITHGQKRFLVCSDIRTDAEAMLIENGMDLRSDVLVVPRFGRYGSTSLELLSMVRPECCIVPASANGRPSRAILERLDPKNTGASLYQTDNDGNISVICDGRSIAVETEGGRQ